MRSDDGKRTLAAIVMADVVGYSRLMGQDERGTLRRLKAARGELVEPTVARHRGRLVDATGDSLLLEFASVVDAVEAAVALQQGLRLRNAPLPAEQRLEYRIGVNIGDVIVQDRALFGDGVNVAARLQALAPPGGICLSRAAVDQVRGKIAPLWEDLGPQAMKNIAAPVEAFVISAETLSTLPLRDAPEKPPSRRAAKALAVGAILAAGAVAAWLWIGRGKDFAVALSDAVAAREPGLAEGRRSRLVADYIAAKPHRAFVFAPAAATHWWSADWPDSPAAREKALERCQIRFGEPCVALADDGELASASPPRDMARVRYAGKFDPAQIPAIRAAVATRTDVLGYAQAPGPKAAALHPHGVFAVVVGATSQHSAEFRALKRCNDDDAARDADGVCFLYAVGDDVVLTRRLAAPITSKEPPLSPP